MATPSVYIYKIYNIYNIYFPKGLHVSNKKQPLVPSKAPLGCKPGKHKLQLGDEISLPAAQVPGSPPGQRAASPKQRSTEPGEPQRFLCIVLGVSLIYGVYIYIYTTKKHMVLQQAVLPCHYRKFRLYVVVGLIRKIPCAVGLVILILSLSSAGCPKLSVLHLGASEKHLVLVLWSFSSDLVVHGLFMIF